MASDARRQPQGLVRINRTNSLARGLVHSWGGYAGTGPAQAVNAAGAAHGVFGAGTSGNPSGNSWRAGPAGYYLNFDDTGTGTATSVALAVGSSSGSGSPGGNTFTFAASIFINTYSYTGGSAGGPLCLYGSATGGIEIRINTSGQLQLLKAGTVSIGVSTATVPLNVDVDVAVSYNGSTASFYINGVLSGTATSAQTFTLATQYYLGYTTVGGTFERMPNGGRIYRADVWNRVLVAAEIKQWSQNVWQVYDDPSQVQARAVAAGGTDAPVNPAAGALALTGYAPTIARSANQGVSPAAAGLALTGYAPAVAQSFTTNVSPGAGSLSLSGYAPAVTQSSARNVAPSAGALTLSGYAPTVARTTSGSVSPGSASLTLTGYAPTVARTASQSVQLGAGGLTLAGYAPLITQAADNAPRVCVATIMRITTTNRTADLGAAVNRTAPIRSTGPNLATIMRAGVVNRTADIGPATINRTVSFP